MSVTTDRTFRGHYFLRTSASVSGTREASIVRVSGNLLSNCDDGALETAS